jgi:hypothetical protein
MSRMYGENAQRYGQRRLGEVDKREINERWQQAHRANSVEIEVPCTCSFRPYPHIVSELPEWERRRHNDPWRHLKESA